MKPVSSLGVVLMVANQEAGVRSSIKRLLVAPRAPVSLIHAFPQACEVNSNRSNQAAFTRGKDWHG